MVNNERTGYLTAKQFQGMTWKAVDRDIDFNTGLTSTSRDAAGNPTTYSFDGLGRLTMITPHFPETQTVISYPTLLETHVTQDLGDGNIVETDYLYDDLGRVVMTKRRNTAGGFDVQKTEYDISGRVTRKSEWAPEYTADALFKWTTYDYTMYTDPDAQPGRVSKHPDPLGRIHGVTTPDDLTPLTPTTETSYLGNTTTVTVRDIQGWNGSGAVPVASTTVYTKDALGRLISVDSPSPGADAQYGYDELDHLTEVRLTDPSSLTHVQVRRFEYDRLGRLRLAANPENGTVEYLAYDARGNLLSYKDARQKIFKMAYDAADRLVSRKQTVSGSDLPLVQNTYDAGAGFNAGGSKGRLVQQDSYKVDNDGAGALVSRVRFGYGEVNISPSCSFSQGGYTGLNGRLSWQTSAIQGSGLDLRTDYCQDALGMPTTISYPDTDPPSGRSRSKVSPVYTYGYLRQLGDAGRNKQYITNVIYAAGGVPKQIDRVASKDLIELDVRNRPRRYRVQPLPPGTGNTPSQPGIFPNFEEDPPVMEEGGESGGGTPEYLWDSGDYSYDMAGNVKTIGPEQHYYDALSRLVHSTIPVVGVTYDLGFGFDAFGNMTGRTRTPSNNPASTIEHTYAVDWRTNRLTLQTGTGGSQLGYAYDENGNMTADNVTAQGGRGLVFDGQGRLREVIDPERGRIGNYDYDASGYRVRVEADGVETFLYRDASGQVLSEFQRQLGDASAPAWNKDYIYAFGKSFALVRNLVPPAPTRLVALPVGNTGLTLSWDAVNEPDLYRYKLVRKWKASGGPSESSTTYYFPATQHSWTDNTYTATNAEARLTYTLTAIDTASNISNPSPALVVYPWAQNNLPLAPTSTSITTTPGDRSVTVRWNPGTPGVLAHNDVWGYYVERATAQAGPFAQLNNSPLIVPEFVDSPLVNGSTYWYRVKTVDTGNRVSAASGAVPGTPQDTIPPGKISDVFAETDRAANRIIVTWKRGIDPDVASYSVYRRTDDLAPTSDTPLATIAVVQGQEQASYSFIDQNATSGTTYYYSIKARDSAVPVNVSAASDRASARSRVAVADPPVIISVSFSVDDKGTTSTDGISLGVAGDYPDAQHPPAPIHGNNIVAEDDDVMQATVRFQLGSGPLYRVYRKAPDEAHFTPVPAMRVGFGTSPYVVSDMTIRKGDYTYFVAGVNAAGEETAAEALPESGPDHFVRLDFVQRKSVRNLNVTDGREFYSTDNKNSRLATVSWSRVTEPALVGYNVYRMCPFFNNCSAADSTMEHFACESTWIRLNTTPVPPEQTFFQDSSTGGLQGCFNYAVRPVGPNGVEGPIGKIVAADLISILPPTQFSAALHFAHFRAAPDEASICIVRSSCPNCSPRGCLTPPVCPSYCESPCPWYCDVSHDFILNTSPGPASNELPAINEIERGTANPALPVPPPTAVTRYVMNKPDYLNGPYRKSKFARVSWTMANPPSDLLGFHVETAGSPNGPWQRLTKHPVAWWERNYITQGVGMFRCAGYSGHTDCLSYRVIAVDEDGNESLPAYASNNPSPTACPTTPEPPKNLRARNAGTASCGTLLEWDPPPSGATEYYVYMTVIDPTAPYFYDTKKIVGVAGSAPVNSYTETGDPLSSAGNPLCEDITCGILTGDPPGSGQCSLGKLAAYYVTARNGSVAGAGESPRSNLVFWKCGISYGDGYQTKVLSDEQPSDAIASLGVEPPIESLASWNTDEPSSDDFGEDRGERREQPSPVELVTAPMLGLGQVASATWAILDLHTDHLGSVRAITRSNGSLASLHSYYPFGEEISSTLSHNTHQYTGHERDKATELDYMLARYYEAGVGRFLSPDPKSGSVTQPQSWNLYTYVGDDPLDKTDPTGTTCTKSGTGYTCQVDSIKRASGKVVKRANFTKSDMRLVKAFEKSYTAAVNKLASNPTATTPVEIGGISKTISAGVVATGLAAREMNVDPFLTGSKQQAVTTGDATTIPSTLLSGSGTLFGLPRQSEESYRQTAIVHEGIHGTNADRLGSGIPDDTWRVLHQHAYNTAAAALLEDQE